MGIRLCLCLLFLVFSNAHGLGSGFNDNPKLNKKSHKENWMESIPDDKLLSAVTIPGTHESLTLYDLPLIQCQAWILENQLYAGLRFFDIRVRDSLFYNILYVMDGHIINPQFHEVLKILLDFLDKHSSETVILRVTLQANDLKKTRKFIKKLTEKYQDKVWTEKKVPYMQDARKKIVFLQTPNFNIGTLNHNTFVIGDDNFQNIEKQVKKITKRLKEAEVNCAHSITLTNTYSTGKPQTHKSLAKVVNDHLNMLIVKLKTSSDRPNCLGIISMDFPSPELIQNIIDINGDLWTGSPEHTEESPSVEPELSEPEPSGFNDDSTLNENSYRERWMESISNDALLSTVTIPGSHESLAVELCQSWTLENQLKAGLRYFHIRIEANVFHNTLFVMDGNSSQTNFLNVLNIIWEFLERYVSETVLLRVTLQNIQTMDETRNLIKTVSVTNGSKIWTKTEVPYMRDVRKKIVFVQSKNFSIGIRNHYYLVTDDETLKDSENKMKGITKRLRETENCGHEITLTDTSAGKALVKMVNDQLNNLIVQLKKGSDRPVCLGIISMEFPSPDLILNIIDVNRPPPRPEPEEPETASEPTEPDPKPEYVITESPNESKKPHKKKINCHKV